MTITAFQLVVLTVALTAAVFDLRTRRIPNALTLGAAAAAIIFHAWSGGWSGAGMSAAGWLTGLALFLPFFALGGLGAADVKLLAALGAWLGPLGALWIALASSLCGGLLAIGVLVVNGCGAAAMRNVGRLVHFWFVTGVRPMPGFTLTDARGLRLAYAVPILAGTAATLWLR
jgi:prepilin peptidase CpaA